MSSEWAKWTLYLVDVEVRLAQNGHVSTVIRENQRKGYRKPQHHNILDEFHQFGCLYWQVITTVNLILICSVYIIPTPREVGFAVK